MNALSGMENESQVLKAFFAIVRRFATGLAESFPQRFLRGERSIWTKEAQEDFERWETEFGEPCGDSEHHEWLDFMDAEIAWGREIPSA